MKRKAKDTQSPSEPATEAESPAMPRKLGANHSETAARPRKHHNNFKQSCDLREDRGIRQIKSSPKNRG